MKAVNLWKTLFCAALAITTFGACSDDDKDDEGGLPSITVNGEASATVAVKLDGGTTDAIEVVSTGSWALTFDDETASSWCHPSRETGGKGKTTLTFTVDPWEGAASNAERQVTAKLLTNGSFEGIPIPKTATITVKQNGAGSTEVTTNVKEIRAQLTFDGKAVANSHVITGIVVSSYEGNNINNHQIMITDNTTESGAGLMVRFKGFVGNKDTDYNLSMGSIVSFDLQGGIAQMYNDVLYQVDFSNAGADPKITIVDSSDNTPDAITITDLSKLADYQSQYVQIYSQPISSIRGEMYYNVSSGYANQTFMTKTGETFQLSFNSYTSSWAKSIEIPSKSGYMKGCVSFNVKAANLAPRNAADLSGLTEDLFPDPTPETTTISQITEAGSYELKNVIVVTRSDKAYMIADNTGAMHVYHDGNVRKVGDKINISGLVTVYQAPNNTPQFNDDATVSLISEGNSWQYDFSEYSVESVKNYFNDVKCVAVQLKGTIVKDGNYFNLVFDGVNDVQGSIQYYTPDASVLDVPVIVKGYAIGKSQSGSIQRIKVFPYEITVDASIPYINATAPATFSADGETIPVAFTAGNLGTNKVFAKLTENAAGQFSVPDGAVSGSSVAVTAKKNETGAAQTAQLTLYIAASQDATPIDQITVALKQAAPLSGDEGAPYAWIMKQGELTTAGGEVNKGEPAMAWTASEVTYTGWDSNASAKGIQIGSSGKPEADFTLTTANYSGKITSIKVNASIGNSGDGKLTVKIGDTQIGETITLTTTATTYTFTPASPVAGSITIGLSATAKAMYIKSVDINPAE